MSPADLERLKVALNAAFNANDLDTLVGNINRKFADYVADRDPLPKQIQSLLGEANRQLWLIELVKEAAAQRPGDMMLAQFVAAMQAMAPPAGVEVFDVCRLVGSNVMIDRIPLRKALRKLATPMDKRILTVTGDRLSGKSHSLQLIAYLQDMTQNFKVVIVELDRLPNKGIVPDTVAKSIRNQMGYSIKIETPTDSQWSLFVEEFCTNLVSAAQVDGTPYWVVIDGFNKVVLSDHTRDLVDGLSLRIHDQLSWMRLVLIGYEKTTLPARVHGQVEEEKIAPITKDQIVEAIGKAFLERPPVPEDKVVVEKIQKILSGVDLNDPEFLAALTPAIQAEL